MVMKRLFPLFALVLVVACNKPSDEMCRKAIRNMRTLLGTDSATSQTDINGDVRRCKGGSTKKAVECAAKATTVDELRACDFMGHKKGGDTEPAGSAPPPACSGTATAGSAGAPTMGGDTGSAAPAGSAAPTGSAAPAGSAAPTGSAAAPAAGSAADSSAAPATGSAADSATGSAATGSAAGSAAGSAK
jgi:hypothetical protein